MDSLAQLSRDVTACTKCKRLVRCREQAAREPPKRFATDSYWAKPVSGFGDPNARLLVLGLAPAAHGGNRTGRVFTGDRSGDWLYGALYRAGFANQAASRQRDDGLTLTDAYVSVVVRCAPPNNRPTPRERDRCLPLLMRELTLLTSLEVIIALGGFAWDGLLRAADRLGYEVATPRPKFGHGARCMVGRWQMFASYHVSQQNTFTGRLTEPMLDAVFAESRAALALPSQVSRATRRG